MLKSHRDVIDAWPGRLAGFADDIGVNQNNAKQMRKRNSIPSTYWLAVEAKGKTRGVAVTVRDLAAMKARQRPKTRQPKKPNRRAEARVATRVAA